MKAIFLSTILVVVVMVVIVLLRLGFFKEVHVTELDEGPYFEVYQKHLGPYHLIVPKMEEIEVWLKSHKFECTMTFGEYIDNPKVVDEDRLQSNAGCIVPTDMSAEKLPEHFLFRLVPRRHYVVATYQGAPSIAPYKVYPKALQYFEEHKQKPFAGPITEIYKPQKIFETEYLFPTD
jgi:AraC family transcriptional regulator